MLTLSWDDHGGFSCAGNKYIVRSTGSDGVCPSTTLTMLTNASIAFSSVSMVNISSQCSFTVQSVCGDIVGNISEPLLVKFRGEYLVVTA